MPRLTLSLPRTASPAAVFYVLACAVFVALPLTIYARYAMDWPRFDDFFIASFLDAAAHGQVTLHELFKPFNEHRVVVGRLLISALAFTFGYNVKIVIGVTLVLMFLAWGVCVHFAWHHTTPERRTPLFYLVNATTAALLLSGMQQAAWLFAAWQPWFLVNAFFLLAVLAAAPASGRPGPLRILGAALACLLASGSAAHGVIGWLALTPLLWQRGVPRRARAAGTLVLLTITAAILIAYAQGIPDDRLDQGLAILLDRPFYVAWNAFAVLGFPMLGVPGLAPVAGVVLAAIWSTTAWSTLRHPDSDLSQARLPWLAIGLLPLLCAPLIAIGRIGLDEQFALHYRYVSLDLLLAVSAMQLAWLWWSHRASHDADSWAMHALAGALLCAIVTRSFDAVAHVRAGEAERVHGALCGELVHYAPPDCESRLALTGPSLHKSIAHIEASGTRQFLTGLAYERQPRVSHGYIDTPKAGRVIRMLKGGGNTRQSAVQVTGWAALAGRAPAQIVLFSYGDDNEFFASTVVSFERRDVAAKMGRAVRSGWVAQISAHYLPPGPGTVYAWTYDRKGKRFVRLGGEVKVFVVE